MVRTLKRIVKIIALFFFLLIVWFAVGEYYPAQDPLQAIGSWGFVRKSRKSCLDILPEGKYKHVVFNNGTVEYEHQDKWTIDEISREKRIIFDNFRSVDEDGTFDETSGYWPAYIA